MEHQENIQENIQTSIQINRESNNQTGIEFLTQMTFNLSSVLVELEELEKSDEVNEKDKFDINELPFHVMVEALGQPPHHEMNYQTAETRTVDTRTVDTRTPVKQYTPKDTPGLIYRIDKGPHTFCVRGVICESLEEQYVELKNKKESHWKALKLGEKNQTEKNQDENFCDISFFPTDTYSEVHSLLNHIINRRFPLSEEDLFNISDPGLSWWLDISVDADKRFDIYFKSQSIEREKKYIKLGPLGDRKIATCKFNDARNWFCSLLEMDQYIVTDKHFAFKTHKSNTEVFLALKTLFMTGEFIFTTAMFSDDEKGKNLYLYLKEISLLRRFWLEIQQQLNLLM